MISKNETWPIVLFFVVAFGCRIILEWGFFASTGAGLAISFLAYPAGLAQAGKRALS